MHFLGLAGHPRRIMDFPDGYLNIHQYNSLGSFISFISVIPFLLAIYYRTDILFNNLSYYSLDHTLQLYRYHHHHAFNTLPTTNLNNTN